MSKVDKVKVIFVSRRNSLRSVLAEACLRHIGGERFTVLSCGVPGQVAEVFHPAAVGALMSAGMQVPKGPPHSWDRLRGPEAARSSFVISLDADTAHRQPSWHGQPDLALWAMPDVVNLQTDEKRALAAVQTLYALRRRLELFVNLPFVRGDRGSIRSDVRDLGMLM